MSKDNLTFCTYCGAPQEKGQKFCTSCGASLEMTKSPSEDTSVKIIKETPLPQSYQQEQHQYGTAAYQEHTYSSVPTQSYVETPVQSSKDNATIAVVLGAIGFVFGCFLIPIAGLTFVKKAKENNEDPQMITIARILNWIQLILQILALIFAVGYLIWFLSIDFY